MLTDSTQEMSELNRKMPKLAKHKLSDQNNLMSVSEAADQSQVYL